MTFHEIEDLLGFKLPASAYEHEAWWSNNATGHSHAHAWLDLGFRTEAINLVEREVTFRRFKQPQQSAAPAERKRDPWGCMAGTVTFLSGVDVTAPSGERWNAEKGRLLND
jgi:hypothetical protein